jgi:lipopolysaccharide/colanic/teichoic acid biosynthesis glycosyltransferase
VEVQPSGGVYPLVKGVADYAIGALLLVFALPIIAVCWAIIKLTSPGPGFYVQTRTGFNGRPYRIIKLRSMHHNCEALTGAQWATQKDTRVFKFGSFLRKTHFDELPQLFNVLMGHMSLVGPRPERPEVIQAKGLERQVPGYRQRLLVKPGVTGLAQVQLPPDLDIASVRHKVVYDLYYIQHESFWLDFRILIATAFKAAGMGPRWIQRVFRLPTRDAVAHVFHTRVVVSPTPSGQHKLLPA